MEASGHLTGPGYQQLGALPTGPSQAESERLAAALKPAIQTGTRSLWTAAIPTGVAIAVLATTEIIQATQDPTTTLSKVAGALGNVAIGVACIGAGYFGGVAHAGYVTHRALTGGGYKFRSNNVPVQADIQEV